MTYLQRILRFLSSRSFRSLRSIPLALERLEDRTVPSAPGSTQTVPLDILLAQAGALASPSAGGPNGPFTPAQIRQAYGFNNIVFDNGTVQGNGSGQTIAIVDAYNDPNILADANAFSAAFGLPQFNAGGPSLKQVNQYGGSTLPGTDSSGGWELEESLDVEWAHAMAPDANIVLVEANAASTASLFSAVQYAASVPGVSVVSMSFGTSESSALTSFDSAFTTPAGHAGVTFIAASGDQGTISYPASSPDVLAVGGTSLSLSSSGNYRSESAWIDSGGGISAVEAEPAYQRAVQTTGMRSSPDVAYDANPNTGYWVYDSSMGGGPWVVVGGTSAGAPQWAALIAIADQDRALQGHSSLDGPSQTLPTLYNLPSSDFHDVTSGSNQGFSATTGYDMVTGLGSPYADRIVAALAGATSSNSTIPGTTSSPPAPVAGPVSSPPVASPPAPISPPPASSPPPATSPPVAPPSPFDEVAADALFMAQGFLAGDFSTVLQGFQDFAALYFQSPAALQPQLRQAMWFDLVSDVFGSPQG